MAISTEMMVYSNVVSLREREEALTLGTMLAPGVVPEIPYTPSS